MNQTLLRINLPKGRNLWPDELRSVVAQQDKDVPPIFMGRDENGNPLSSPPIRFVGSQSWVGAVAQPGQQAILLSHVGAVLRAAGNAIGSPCPAQVEEHEFGIEASHIPLSYVAHNVAIKCRSQRARGTNLNELFEQRLIAALERQATDLGMDCPTGEDLEVGNIDIKRSLGMALKTDRGITKEMVTLLPRVEFTMFAKLKGYWFAGNLAARGYGRIHEQRIKGSPSRRTQFNSEEGALV